MELRFRLEDDVQTVEAYLGWVDRVFRGITWQQFFEETGLNLRHQSMYKWWAYGNIW